MLPAIAQFETVELRMYQSGRSQYAVSIVDFALAVVEPTRILLTLDHAKRASIERGMARRKETLSLSDDDRAATLEGYYRSLTWKSF
jgi:hypothetical protein